MMFPTIVTDRSPDLYLEKYYAIANGFFWTGPETHSWLSVVRQ